MNRYFRLLTKILSTNLNHFKRCHKGLINKLFHVLGFGLIGLGIFYKDVFFVLAGALTQEAGHFYQYIKTKNPKDSPLHCLKPQAIFAYPVLALIVLYILYYQ